MSSGSIAARTAHGAPSCAADQPAGSFTAAMRMPIPNISTMAGITPPALDQGLDGEAIEPGRAVARIA